MKQRLTTEQFIEKAKLVHGDKYDYSLVIYEKSNLHIKIICSIHGEFNQTPNCHLSNSGCDKCAQKIIADKNRLTKDDFINKSNKIHNNFYNYKKTDYVKSSDKVIITCPIHGDFVQVANAHIQGIGCYQCGEIKRIESKKVAFSEFLKRAYITHNNRYTYIEDSYDCITSKMEIICDHHGVFTQICNNHLKGMGCPVCGDISRSKLKKENPVGWSYSNWQKASQKSKDFDSFKIYILKCSKNDEIFYKIGRTYLKIKRRFHSKKSMPYDYIILKEITSEKAKDTCELEWILKNCNKNNKYIPEIKFSGMYECFKELDMSCFEGYNLEI